MAPLAAVDLGPPCSTPKHPRPCALRVSAAAFFNDNVFYNCCEYLSFTEEQVNICYPSSCVTMPAATHDQQQQAFHGPKRRLDDDHQHEPMLLYTPPAVNHSPPLTPHMHRRVNPSMNPKRLRRSPQHDDDLEMLRLKRASTFISPMRESHPQPQEPHGQARHHDTTTPAQLLNRCHICHRKPSKKTDLDSFADCQGCGQRTCFVCIRQCLDWRSEHQKRWSGYGAQSFEMKDADEENDGSSRQQHPGDGDGQGVVTVGWAKGGHWKMICSRCCVERGPDGDVVCLGCLPFVEG